MIDDVLRPPLPQAREELRVSAVTDKSVHKDGIVVLWGRAGGRSRQEQAWAQDMRLGLYSLHHRVGPAPCSRRICRARSPILPSAAPCAKYAQPGLPGTPFPDAVDCVAAMSSMPVCTSSTQ